MRCFLLLAVCLFVGLVAADPTPGPFGLDPALDDEAAPLPPADQGMPFGPGPSAGGATPADASATPALRPTSHRPWTDALRAFCATKHVALTESGDGPVRLVLVGAANVKGDEILRLAKQTLEGYERWTGGQESFAAKVPLADDVYHLVVFASDGDYGAFVDHLRAEKMIGAPTGDEDLTKKLGGFPGTRTMFAKAGMVATIPGHWGIYATSCLAIDAFYRARGDHRAPPWIREGMAAEMQRIQLTDIRCTTIAYEDRKEAAVGNWAKEVARLISTNDQMAISASAITRLSLDALPGAHYRQMWSLCTYVRGICGATKGDKNRFHQLLVATANGASSESALKTVLKRSDPALTQAWRAWALAQK